MKVIICAGTATTGKTSVLKHVIRKLSEKNYKSAYLKVDVQYATEAEDLKKEFSIPTKTVYSGELCPDHCNVMLLSDAINWAEREKTDFLIVETAGLCLRCSPYVEGALGVMVLEATSGMNLPQKIGPMLTLADVAVITKVDLISQAEREVFRARIMERAKSVQIFEVNALYGIGIDLLIKEIEKLKDVVLPTFLRGNPPVGTCTVCVGKKEIGWQQHFGVVRTLESEDIFYKGE